MRTLKEASLRLTLMLASSSVAFAQDLISPKKIEAVTAPIKNGSSIFAGTPGPADPAPKADAKPVGKNREPPLLQGLAQTVTAARIEELPLRNFNPVARILSIPEQTESQGGVRAATRTTDGVTRSIIVRRLSDPSRVDIILLVSRGGVLHIYHTDPDGLLQTAVRRADRTNTTVSGRKVDTAFRDEIQTWRNWEKEYLRQQAEKSRDNGQIKNAPKH